MSKWPTKVKRKRVPTYHGRIAFCRTREEYAACCAAMQCPDELEKHKGAAGLTTELHATDGRIVHLVGWFDDEVGTLVHELVHAAANVLRHAGVPITKDNDEALAYVIDSLYVLSPAPQTA